MSDALAQFIPILFISFIYACIMFWVAGKLGRNRFLWFVYAIIPIFNFFFLWYSVWRAIIDIHNRLKAIEDSGSA